MTEASLQVSRILRSTENLQWYIVPLFVFVIYFYIMEIETKNWSAVLIGISTFFGEAIWEMFNALILHFSGYAPLWSTPGKSAFVIYAGLNIEIAFFFAIAGLLVVKSLPEDRNMKIFGLPNRRVIPFLLGLVCVIVEISLNRGGLLVWDYPWWSWPHIWLILVAYTAPWYLLAWCHDNMSMTWKVRWALILPPAAILCHLIFATLLGWI